MTIQQRKYFFELCDKAGIDKQEAEQKAKDKYADAHPKDFKFTDLTNDEISPLLAILEKEVKKSQVLAVAPRADFPNKIRVWDREEERMIYDVSDETEFHSWEPTAEPERYHKMHWTGLKDVSGKELYDFDLFKNVLNKIFIVQWSWRDAAWVGYDSETNESFFLSSFGKRFKIGSTYEGVEE